MASANLELRREDTGGAFCELVFVAGLFIGRSRMWKTNSSVNSDENYHFLFEFWSWSSVVTAREHCLVASKRDTMPPVAVREEEMGLN